MADTIDTVCVRLDRIKFLTAQFLRAAETKSPDAPRLADQLTQELEATKAEVRRTRTAN